MLWLLTPQRRGSLPIRRNLNQLCTVGLVLVALFAVIGVCNGGGFDATAAAASDANDDAQLSLFELEETVADLNRAEDIITPTGSSPLPLFASSMALPHASLCPVLYVYYDSTCGHCRTMAPRISAFARSTVQDPLTQYLLIGAVNCASHVEACNAKNVTDVPTIFFAPDARPQQQRQSAAATTASTGRDWVQLPAALSTAAAIAAVVRPLISPIVDVMPPNQRDICELTKQFLMRHKGRNMPPHPVAQRDAANDASAAAGGGGGQFVEERAFHSSDVAASLFYALYHEVPLVSLSSMAHRRVLSQFLETVERYLPGLRVAPLIEQLAVGNGDGAITAPKEWRSAVLDARLPWEGTAPDRPQWRTCRGSSWKYRGYTCGMWLLYHSLLANAPDAEGLRVVGVVRAFVTTFFSCADCRTHFGQFAWVAPERHPHHWSVGLQLWAAHNSVNRRLQRVADGQDPLVPKRMFPDSSLCKACLRHGDDRGDTAAAASTGSGAGGGGATDDAAAAEVLLALTYVTPRVAVFLREWFHWDPSTLPPPRDGGRGDAAPIVATEPPPPPPPSDCDGSGDTCPMEAPHRTPTHPSSLCGGGHGGGVWFVRTRHPSFVVKRDPLWAHMLLTLLVVVSTVGLGYAYASRRGLGGVVKSAQLRSAAAAAARRQHGGVV